MNTFDQSFDRLMVLEGGYTPGAGDPGGETKWGLSKRCYPDLNIASLTREQAKEIYMRDFWTRAKMDQYDPAVAFQVFDFAVNSGIETAIRKMQRAAGVADDGHVGPITVAALKAMTVTDFVMLYVAERLDYWTRLSNWQTAGKGWARRAAADLRYAAADT
ncbi:MAG TPA: glycosyl hydrolase 108 family protein [Usitatibacter sp.]|nr:glycosyl hydrolase 108 family protein [Usitatibacter sp.]